MRKRKVEGLIPKMVAAPLGPLMRHPVASRTFRIKSNQVSLLNILISWYINSEGSEPMGLFAIRIAKNEKDKYID
jgi:hypothetical protein